MLRKYLAVILMLLAFTSAVSANTAGFDDVESCVTHQVSFGCSEKFLRSILALQRFCGCVLCGSGKVYTGVNVENASYPVGLCAECNAIFHAAAEGERTIRAVAVTGGTEHVITEYCSPCGICRQVMREFGAPENVLVIMAKSEEDYIEMTLEQLLPLSFGPEYSK